MYCESPIGAQDKVTLDFVYNKLVWLLSVFHVAYFFAYKTEFFFFQNNPKNLDPSYKMDLDLWDCLGRVKLVLQQNCI